jgi:hypothetical protein
VRELLAKKVAWARVANGPRAQNFGSTGRLIPRSFTPFGDSTVLFSHILRRGQPLVGFGDHLTGASKHLKIGFDSGKTAPDHVP